MTWFWILMILAAWVIGVACGAVPFIVGGSVAYRDRQVPTDRPPGREL